MRIVQINTTCGSGSTGKICLSVSKLLSEKNIENYVFYTQGKSDYPCGVKFASDRYKKIQALKSRIFGNYGFNSKNATRRLLHQLNSIQPDIVHLHNIHGHDCDLEMLLRYIKAKRIKLYWTFHDCWAFTAYCPHFDMIGCDQWKTECHDCPQIRDSSWFFDRSRTMFARKKELLSGLDLTIITPSRWLADMVGQSFLKDYPVQVINNGIDLSIFRPVECDFRQRNGLDHKKIVLGVAFGWDRRKGLDVFVELANRLDERYQIVLVGTDDGVDKHLPEKILSIHRTANQQELAEIYTAADVFVNPTREENYPTVNMESLACGTPVVTFRTGGSPEIPDDTCGSVVDKNDVNALEREIIRICSDQPYSKEQCVNKATEFDKNERFKEYVELYERVIATGTERN